MTAVPTHSAAPSLPEIRREQRVRERHLRVAATARRRRRARRTIWLTGAATAFALFVLVAFHVLAVQHSFTLDRLADEQRTEELRYERLRMEVATLSSPQAIVDGATQRGMQPATAFDWIDAPAAAPPAAASEQTSSTLADIHGEAKQTLVP